MSARTPRSESWQAASNHAAADVEPPGTIYCDTDRIPSHLRNARSSLEHWMHPLSTTEAASPRIDPSKSILLSYESDGVEVSLYKLASPLNKVWLEVSLSDLSVASARSTELVCMGTESDADLLDFIMRACFIAKQWRAEMSGQPAQQWLDALLMHLATSGPPYAESSSTSTPVKDLH